MSATPIRDHATVPRKAINPRPAAVAAAVAQGRADWGMAISSVARDYGLGFLPVADEHYDLFVPEGRLERPAVRAFLDVLDGAEAGRRLSALGFVPSGRAAIRPSAATIEPPG